MKLYLMGVSALVLIYVFGIGQPLIQLIAAGLLAIVAIPAWRFARREFARQVLAHRIAVLCEERANRRANLLHRSSSDQASLDHPEGSHTT